ncbi:MAG: CBS domain-containing protein [Bacteroidota bacterium]|nr:CBS domain-containing protein [Bacteroidota bacterium]
MNLTAPVSTIMSQNLITLIPGDPMSTVEEIFNRERIHHIPVVRYTQLVGIISKTDFLHFMKGLDLRMDNDAEEKRLSQYKVEDIMTTGIATLESTERINVALEIFAENLFHAIPIVDDGKLVGILSTYDIIKKLREEDQARIMAH